MYQTIHEDISVIGIFQQGTFLPKKFRWAGRTQVVESVTLVSKERDGQVPLHHYSVVSQGTVYRLLFYPESCQWFLEEIWHEGA